MKQINKSDIDRFLAIIGSAGTITIVTHMNPDGDALGSSFALLEYLKSKHGKDVMVVDSDPVPDSLRFVLNGNGNLYISHKLEPLKAEARLMASDTVIGLDFNTFKRTGSLEDILPKTTATKVLIDHHLSPDTESFDLVFSEIEISSASELLYHILMEMPDVSGDAGNLPPKSAAALMTGMTTDTNNFANSVYPSTLEMASSLLAAGVDRDAIVAEIYNRYRENRIRLQGHLLSQCLKITDEGVAYMILDQKTKDMFDTQEGETEGFVNIPLAIDNVRMSIFLKEDGDRMRVSIRSKKGTSANRMAREWFNGGGHELASGGRLSIPSDVTSPEDAEQYILKAIKGFFVN